MTADAAVTQDLVETLEDGMNGYAKGAEKLTGTDQPGLASVFQKYAAERERFVAELRGMAAGYGDQVRDNGTVAAAVHRGWMTVKDAFSGSDPQGVLDVALQGEDHAITKFENALVKDISGGLRSVAERQLSAIRAARSEVAALRAASH